ncbi:hypothetical protein BLNAU_20673 [Blattamonas nauphoetae]|uniref:Uncharacterized protein n=1 Tax=Blattamonas nauphoetae TaxID=2049346 RepID=A0ABQ9WYM8_9EUKA|nr:hypothetical protein BLNAU_20673 [Blattamonas nauphoetae]
MDFVLESPIVTTFSSCLPSIEDDRCLRMTLVSIDSQSEWKEEGHEVVQTGKRMMQALLSEGFEDTLEQMMKHTYSGDYRGSIASYCHTLSRLSSDVGNAVIADTDKQIL